MIRKTVPTHAMALRFDIIKENYSYTMGRFVVAGTDQELYFIRVFGTSTFTFNFLPFI